MTKGSPGEQWKAVKVDFQHSNDLRMQVSSLGRVRSFGKFSDGNILNGSLINGYRIIRSKFFRERDKKKQKELDIFKQRVLELAQQIKSLKERNKSKIAIRNATAELTVLKKSLSKKFRDDEKERTIYYHSLVHRMVANCFLKKPSRGHTIVGHLDYDKLNNKANNLKWMKPEENYVHQKSSPHVIAEKEERANKPGRHPTAKLTVTKVMLLKKLLNENKPVRKLAKRFKVTETQIIRIRKGENWKNVQAAT